MRVNNIDNESEHTQQGVVPEIGNAAVHAVHELNRSRAAEALREFDERGFSRLHLKVCLVAGMEFFTDAYDIFAINLASVMLGYVYGHTPGPGLDQDFGIKVAAPAGNVFRQLLFGWLADIVRRKRKYGIALMVILTSISNLWIFSRAIVGK